jgi:hypothetical protein
VVAHGATSLVPLFTGVSAEPHERCSSKKAGFVWPTSIRCPSGSRPYSRCDERARARRRALRRGRSEAAGLRARPERGGHPGRTSSPTMATSWDCSQSPFRDVGGRGTRPRRRRPPCRPPSPAHVVGMRSSRCGRAAVRPSCYPAVLPNPRQLRSVGVPLDSEKTRVNGPLLSMRARGLEPPRTFVHRLLRPRQYAQRP